MKQPNFAEAIVPPKKVTEYLLSITHRDGRGKAKFFIRFGFSPDHGERLAVALQRHALENAVVKHEISPFGVRYVVEGRLLTPTGEQPWLRSIWFLEEGEQIPRFVTALSL